MKFGSDLWEAIKQAERAATSQGSPATLALRLHLSPPTQRSAIQSLVDGLGGEVTFPAKARTAEVRLPASSVPQVVRWPGLQGIELSLNKEQRWMTPRHIFWLGAAGVGIALAIWLSTNGLQSANPPAFTPSVAGSVVQPHNPKEHFNQVLVAYLKGDKLAAIDQLKELVSHQPGYRAARMNLGWLLLEIGRPKEASRQFEAILAAHPNDLEARSALEIAQTANGSGERH